MILSRYRNTLIGIVPDGVRGFGEVLCPKNLNQNYFKRLVGLVCYRDCIIRYIYPCSCYLDLVHNLF